MDAGRILDSFLVARSRLEDIVAESQFERLGPPEVYRELCLQRGRTVDTVKSNVESQLDIPVHDIAAEVAVQGSGQTVESLVASLRNVQASGSTQETVLDEKIAACIDDIKKLTEVVKKLAQQDPLEPATDSLDAIGKMVEDGLK